MTPEGTCAAPADAREGAEERDTWVERLRGEGERREQALFELHALLLRVARSTVAKKLAGLGRERREELAAEAADEALMSILAHLDAFRGESRFTTWAWKFAFYEACVAVRRQRWVGREVPVEEDGWEALSWIGGPEAALEKRELLEALRDAIEHELTPHQRRVFVALALNEVPIDVLAQRLGTSRGALYKTLHDARQRLRVALDAAGLLAL
jgi:RNA polymerase sigma-70 factor (ECF subfamily)